MNLTVLDANLWLFPYRISAHNMDRFDRFLDLVQKLDPDIITMQEVWSSSYVIRLREAMQGYHIIASDKFLYNTAGLVTATKAVPIESKIHYFGDEKPKGLIEKIGRKGFHRQVFKTPDGVEKYVLVNTHLYNCEAKREEGITNAQIGEIEDACEGDNLIIAGDLNMRIEQFMRINHDKRYHHQAQPPIIEPNIYQNRRFNRFLRYLGTVDYVLARSGSMNMRVESAKFITEPAISDHPTVFARVNLERK